MSNSERLATVRRLLLVLAAALVCNGAGLDPLENKPAITTITGEVKVAETNRGRVLAVYIADPEEGDFLVLRGTVADRALTARVGETVTARGYVRKARDDSGFEKIIDVIEFDTVTS